MKVLSRLQVVVVAAFTSVVETFKREPALVRLALMGALGSLAVFTPDQLSGIDGFLDRVTPALLILLGADLRSSVTPAKAPRQTVSVPALPRTPAPSGAF